MENFLTPEEAAEQLLVKPTTIKSWLREGKLKGIKAGKFWRIPTSEFSHFLQSGATRISATDAANISILGPPTIDG